MPTLSSVKGTTDAAESQPIGLTARDENSIDSTGRNDGLLAHRARSLSEERRATENEQGDAQPSHRSSSPAHDFFATNFIPHLWQLLGLSERTSGCIGQVY